MGATTCLPAWSVPAPAALPVDCGRPHSPPVPPARPQVRWLRQLSDPWVRIVDKIAGEAVVSYASRAGTGWDKARRAGLAEDGRGPSGIGGAFTPPPPRPLNYQAMRVEVDFEGGKNSAGIFVHKKLPEAMGHSVAGFAVAMLGGGTAPGVWYPEEKEALAVGAGAAWAGF
jgi:hypothetical protein